MKRKAIDTIKQDNKHSNIKSFIDYPGGDWIIPGDSAANLSHQILSQLNISVLSSILLPGIGFSSLAFELWQLGYQNLTLLDIEESSFLCQKQKFQCINVEVHSSSNDNSNNNQGIKMILSNILLDEFKYGLFDCVIDKGFMDVFLRQGQSIKCWSKCLQWLKPNTGIYICFSIFHKKWKRYITCNHFKSAIYSSVAVNRYSSTRPTIKSFSCPGALLIAGNCDLQQFIKNLVDKDQTSLVMTNFYKMNTNSFPSDASLV